MVFSEASQLRIFAIWLNEEVEYWLNVLWKFEVAALAFGSNDLPAHIRWKGFGGN